MNQTDHHSQTESMRPRPLLSPNHAGPIVVHRRCAASTHLVSVGCDTAVAVVSVTQVNTMAKCLLGHGGRHTVVCQVATETAHPHKGCVRRRNRQLVAALRQCH